MSEYSYNADAKEATVFTKQHNAAFAQQFAIDLEDAYNSEVALARRGCLKKLDGFRLKDKTGNVVWDLQAYDFLKQQAVADIQTGYRSPQPVAQRQGEYRSRCL